MARRRPPPRPDDAPPRSEAEWEAEFRRMDLISDRFGELLETLADDPDRHAKIAREMGWFQDDDVEDLDEDDDDFDAAADDDDDLGEDGSTLFDPFTEEGDDAGDRADRAAVPAYGAAVDLGRRVMAVVDDHRGDKPDPPDEPTTDGESDGELFGRAFIGVQIAAAKLIGGHAMGYDDEVLCGNIVNCRRALAAATDGRQAWRQVRDRRLVPANLVDELLAEHDRVIAMIEERIAELRGRVHW